MERIKTRSLCTNMLTIFAIIMCMISIIGTIHVMRHSAELNKRIDRMSRVEKRIYSAATRIRNIEDHSNIGRVLAPWDVNHPNNIKQYGNKKSLVVCPTLDVFSGVPPYHNR